ncbi:PLC-like phosphodiesterase [Mycena floridula]|nr:PLC-like phosphodiesterase [Mycena floridula]
MIFAVVSIYLWATYAVGIAIPVARPPIHPPSVEPIHSPAPIPSEVQAQQIPQSLLHQIIPETHPTTFSEPTVCNGSPALCARPYDNVTYLGAHDSMAWSEKHLAWARDQLVPISTQLDSGARLLQAQAHFFEGELRFCHTSCHLFDGGLVVDYLVEAKQWLLSHPNEVLTFIFTNPERVSVVKEWMPLFEKAGLGGDMYFPGSITGLLPNEATKINTWPLLGDMIRTGKRVVVFLDQFGLDEDYPALVESLGPHENYLDLHADYPSHSNEDYPSIADDHYPSYQLKYGGNGSGRLGFVFREWGRIWETPFSVTDPNFPCSIDRIGTIATHTAAHAKELAANKGRARGEAPTQMYMINHSLNWNLLGIKISNPDTADQVNGVTSMSNHVKGCLPFSVQGAGSHRTSRHAVKKAYPTQQPQKTRFAHQQTGFSLTEISGEQERMLWPSSSHQRRAPGARNPTFMLLDWVNVGEGKRAVDEMNGVA